MASWRGVLWFTLGLALGFPFVLSGEESGQTLRDLVRSYYLGNVAIEAETLAAQIEAAGFRPDAIVYPRNEDAMGISPSSASDVHVAIDPGHVGGRWARLEGRSFQIGEGTRLQEGDLVLAVAERLRDQLEALGMRVSLIRSQAQPVATDAAGVEVPSLMTAWGGALWGPSRDDFRRTLRAILVSAEIRARAERIRQLQPDLVLVLHINAEPWPDPTTPSLVQGNHFHLIVSGNALTGEWKDRQTRNELIARTALGFESVERSLALRLAPLLAEAWELPPSAYSGPAAERIDVEGYVWGRNLAATRLYLAPVVYLEPFILNSEAVYPNLQDVAGRDAFVAGYADVLAEALRTVLLQNPRDEDPPPSSTK